MKRYIVANQTILIIAITLVAFFAVSCISRDVPTSTTQKGILRSRLEIVTQGRTYKPLEHFVYSLHDGLCADGKWFDKIAFDMDPELKADLEAAESIPYADDFTFLRVWTGGSEKGPKLHFHVYDSQMEQIMDRESFNIPSGDGLYYVAALLHVGNNNEYTGYQYIFKVVRNAWNPATIKAELKKLPQNYEPDNAIQNGCFVIQHGKLLSDPQLATDFIAASKAGKVASLRIVQYTVEGDPIIMHIDHRNGVFHGLLDESRDSWGRFGSEIVEYEMPYLAVFENEERTVAYLVKENDLTLEAINTLLNQNPNGPEDLVFLYLYNKN